MIQRTFDVTNESELLWMKDWLTDYVEYSKAKTVFLQFYLSRFSSSDAEKVVRMLKMEVPRLKIVGMSLFGDPFVGLNTDKLMRFNFCFFSESDVTVVDYDFDGGNIDGIISDFRKTLSNVKNPAGVLVLGSGITLPASKFMDDASEEFSEVPFFGSIANINTDDVEDQSPYAFGNRMIKNGFAVAIFSGENLHFYSESLFSWKPIGKEMLAETGNPGVVGDSLITKIDGLPAAQIYKKYLNVDTDAHFISNICEFPIVVSRNNYLMARVPCGYNSKGELNTMGDIRNGEYIRFTYGKSEEILQKTLEASARMSDFMPEAIFLYACANRAIFLKSRAQDEITFYRRIVRGMVYCHGFSELYRYKNQGGVFNSQLVTIGLREGEPKMKETFCSLLPGISFDSCRAKINHQNQKSSENGSEEEKETNQFFKMRKEVLSQAENAEKIYSSRITGVNSNVCKSMMMGENESNNSDEPNITYGNSVQSSIGVSIPIADRLVTFLEAITKELNEATQAAEAANKAKSNFLSNMSHEIRTPINAVLGLDEMILRESTEPQIKQYAADIMSSGKSLLSTVNDILDFSKIEAGKMEIIPAEYDLSSTINDLVNMISKRAHDKGLELVLDIDEKIPHVLFGDEIRIKQCAVNILTNAVKYTNKGSVKLSVLHKKLDDENIALTFHVKDTGIGIKEEDLPKLTEAFQRIEEKRNRTIEGTGLGMSIVKQLLELMGSKIEVESVYGKGSDFHFTVKQKVVKWEPIGNFNETYKKSLESMESYQESFTAPDAKILVVDDTKLNLTVVKGLLKQTKIQIDTAESGAEALNLVKKNKYDMLFIDHRMPVMDGIETLEAMKTLEGNLNHHVPTVALTANAVSGAREMYLNAGFTDYLTKPIDSKKLEKMLVHYLPKEKVNKTTDARQQTIDDNQKTESHSELDSESSSKGKQDCFAALAMTETSKINLQEGIKNCGGEEILLSALEDFYNSIEEKADSIEKFASQKDFKNFTVLVHALKSSARIIGAGKLSEDAKYLEQCGDDKNTAEIDEKTPALLELFRSYKEVLAPLFESKQSDDGKPEMSEEMYKDAISNIKEALTAFDFDTADSILEMMSDYKIPENHKNRFENLKKKIAAVDQKAALEILG